MYIYEFSTIWLTDRIHIRKIRNDHWHRQRMEMGKRKSTQEAYFLSAFGL